MVKTDCDGCKRYAASCAVVSKWLQVEIGNATADQIHLVATLRSSIEALGPRNPKLHPPRAKMDGADEMCHPAPGEDMDAQAARLAANCPTGYEEAEAALLRRAADVLMKRAHGRERSYRGESRGAYRVPLRLLEPEDLSNS